MRPILFDEDATSFETYGIGELTDAISCMVNEGINDIYELEMDYPVNGAYFSEIQNGRIIGVKVKPGNKPEDKKRQGFRIYSISKPISGEVTISARHVSYDLSGWVVRAMDRGTCGYGLQEYINYIANNAMVSDGREFPFTITTELVRENDDEETDDNRFAIAMPVSIRSLMGTDEGSIVDMFGGEWKYDNFNCTLVESLGYDNGVKVEYGVNLIDLTQEENIEDAYSGIYPFYGTQETIGPGYESSNIWDLQYKQDVQRVPWAPEEEAHSEDTPHIFAPPFLLFSNVKFPKILPVNLQDKLNNRPPETAVQLIEKANEYIEEEKPGTPKVSLTISFINWGDILGEDFFTEVGLGDVLHVYFKKLGVQVDDGRCIATTFDVLLDRYDSYTIGDSTDELSDNIVKKASEATLVTSQKADQAIEYASSAVTEAAAATTEAERAIMIATQAISSIEYNAQSELITFKMGTVLSG